MNGVGLIILAIVGVIVILALCKIIAGGKKQIKANHNQFYSAIGLLILIISFVLTILFKQ